nr:unnamed protein product [Callosobruchus analis]
MMKEFQIV